MNFRSFSTLQIALGVSIAVHAVLLTVRFVDPEGFNRIFQDTPLEVILVNAKSAVTAYKICAMAEGGTRQEKGNNIVRPVCPPATELLRFKGEGQGITFKAGGKMCPPDPPFRLFFR